MSVFVHYYPCDITGGWAQALADTVDEEPLDESTRSDEHDEWEIERRYNPAELRIPRGAVGGGRWRDVHTIIIGLLRDWASGEGKDNPLADFDAGQLHRFAKESGISIRHRRNGESDESFKTEVTNTILASVRAGHNPAAKAAPAKAVPGSRSRTLTPGQSKLLIDAHNSRDGVINVNRDDPDVKALVDRGYLHLDPSGKDRAETTPAGALRGSTEASKAAKAARPKVDLEQQARDRQAAIDHARGYGEVMVEADELIHNSASPQALAHRLRSRAKLHGIEDDMGPAIAAAEAGDMDRVRAEIAKLTGREKLRQVGRAGMTTRFDPDKHSRIADVRIETDERVRMVRPGWSYRTSDGKTVTVKPVVEAVPAKAARPSGAARPATVGPDRYRRAAKGERAMGAVPVSLVEDEDSGDFSTHGLPASVRANTDRYTRALRRWTSTDGSTAMTRHLNGTQTGSPEVVRDVAAIDEVMTHSRLSRDAELHRGVPDLRRIFGDRVDGDLTGVERVDPAFAATGIDEDTAHFYAGLDGSSRAVMRILTPKGTGAVVVQSPAQGAPGGGGPEGEILLDRNLRYRVIRDYGQVPSLTDPEGRDTVRRLDVEIVASPSVRVPAKKATPGRSVGVSPDDVQFDEKTASGNIGVSVGSKRAGVLVVEHGRITRFELAGGARRDDVHFGPSMDRREIDDHVRRVVASEQTAKQIKTSLAAHPRHTWQLSRQIRGSYRETTRVGWDVEPNHGTGAVRVTYRGFLGEDPKLEPQALGAYRETLEARGFHVTVEPDGSLLVAKGVPSGLAGMTQEQLREYARIHGISIPADATSLADIRAAIRRGGKPTLDIKAWAAHIRGHGGTGAARQVDIIDALDSEPALTGPRLRELAAELGIEIPAHLRNAQASKLQLYIAQVAPHGGPSVPRPGPLKPPSSFDAVEVAHKVANLTDVPAIMGALDGLNVTQLRRVADELNVAIPADFKGGAQALRKFIAEATFRDRGRWHWR